MGLLSWIFMGLVVGVFTKFIIPVKYPEGIIYTLLLGIGGALLGGFIGSYLGYGTVTGYNLESLLMSTGGAAIILIIYGIIKFIAQRT